MKTIAFDTSNQPLSVAIFEDDKLVDQRATNVLKNHSVQLLPFMDELLKAAGWQPNDLDQVIVSQGPGSYTGLRIAVTTAKTLAFTLNLALVGISSLALLAANVTATDKLIVPIMDARNDNMYVGGYRYLAGRLTSVQADRHSNLQKLIDDLKATATDVIFVGEVGRFELALREALPTAEFSTTNLPNAANLMMLAELEKPITDIDAIHQFVPNYLRLSQAEVDWAKAHPGVSHDGFVEKV